MLVDAFRMRRDEREKPSEGLRESVPALATPADEDGHCAAALVGIVVCVAC